MAKKNVADVAVEARETKRVAAPLENLTRFLRQRERLLVPPEREDALKQTTVERPADVDLLPQRAKQLERRLVALQGFAVVAAEQRHVPHGSKALGAAAVVSQLVGDPQGGVRQAFRLSQIHSRHADDPLVEAFDDGRSPQLGPMTHEGHQRTTTRLRRKLIEQRAGRLQ